MSALRVSASAVKVLLGMTFMVSAAAKFVSVDAFEMYVYSFAFLPLSFCFFVARLVIASELLLGAALISNRHHRLTVTVTLLFLLCFTVFLAYAQLVGRSDNCHCFGDLMQLNPIQSILKNVFLIVLLLFVSRFASQEWALKWLLVVVIYLATLAVIMGYMIVSMRVVNLLAVVMIVVMMAVGILASFPFYGRWYVTAMLVMAPFVTIFILTPPDNWLFQGSDERFDDRLFVDQFRVVNDDVEAMPLSGYGLDKGRHLVAFLSPNCTFCRHAAGKISIIVGRHDIDTDKVLYVFPVVKDSGSYERFYEASRSSRFTEAFIDKELFIRITRAAFPLVLLMEDGDVKASFAYRNINESMVADFMIGN